MLKLLLSQSCPTHRTPRRRASAGRGLGLLLFVLLGLSAGLSVRAEVAVPEQLSLNRGLSQSTVFSITQDSTGFLWLGTRDGLNRFDGYSFEEATTDQALPSRFIWALAREGDELWLGTQGAGLLHRSVRGQLRVPAGGPEVVVSIVPSGDGQGLWLGSLDQGLVYHHKSAGSFTRDTTLASSAVWSVLEEPAGDLWLGTAAHGLAHRAPGQAEWHYFRHDSANPTSISGDNIWKVISGRDQQLWVASFGAGLNRFDKATGHFQRFRHDPERSDSLSSDHVWTLLEDRKGRLWVGTNNGLNLLQPNTGRFEHYLQGQEIKALYEDNSGIIWVGTYYNGVYRLDARRNKFELINHANGKLNTLPLDMANGIAETADSLWVASDGGGLTRFERASGKVSHFTHNPRDPQSLGSNHTMTLAELNSGELLIGTFSGGMDSFDPTLGTFRHYRPDGNNPTSISDDTVFDILQDRQGRVWVATWRGGLNRFDPLTGEFHAVRAAPGTPGGLADDYIQVLFEDQRGRLWLGTASGLQRYLPEEQRFLHYPHDPANPDSLNHNHIYSIADAGDGKLWVGTEAGLNLFNPDTGASQPVQDSTGFLNQSIYGILTDFRNHLWLSTRNGLVRMDPQTRVAQRYDEGDGIQAREFIAGSYLQGRDGHLYFGGVGGLNRIDPRHLESNLQPPPVVINRLRILNSQARRDVDLVGTDRVTLAYHEQPFALNFTGLNFTRSELNRYTYRLSGLSERWLQDSHHREAIYYRLTPGTYRFEVKASNNDGVWNEQPATLELTILPPWWLSRGAWLGYSLLGVLLFTLLWNWRSKTRRAEQARDLAQRSEQAKQEFLAKMSHEIRTPLSGMISMAALLQRTHLNERQQRYLTSLLNAGNALLNIINDILDFSRIEADKVQLQEQPFDLHHLLQELLELFQVEAGRRQLLLQLDYATDLPHHFSGDQTRLRQILSNLIGNAVKFTETGGIWITVRRVALLRSGKIKLAIDITDSGIGIESDRLERVFDDFEQGEDIARHYGGTGLGLSIARQLTRLMQGELTLSSQFGIGTTAHLKLPLAAAQPLPSAALPEHTVHGFYNRARVLMVEDNEINAVALQHLLEDLGCRVTLTRNGREALDYLAGQDVVPDLILMDRHMPVLDGLEATRLIRRDPRWQTLPVVALTASLSLQDKTDCLQAGMNEYVVKPLLCDKAMQLLQHYCGEHTLIRDAHPPRRE